MWGRWEKQARNPAWETKNPIEGLLRSIWLWQDPLVEAKPLARKEYTSLGWPKRVKKEIWEIPQDITYLTLRKTLPTRVKPISDEAQNQLKILQVWLWFTEKNDIDGLFWNWTYNKFRSSTLSKIFNPIDFFTKLWEQSIYRLAFIKYRQREAFHISADVIKSISEDIKTIQKKEYLSKFYTLSDEFKESQDIQAIRAYCGLWTEWWFDADVFQRLAQRLKKNNHWDIRTLSWVQIIQAISVVPQPPQRPDEFTLAQNVFRKVPRANLLVLQKSFWWSWSELNGIFNKETFEYFRDTSPLYRLFTLKELLEWPHSRTWALSLWYFQLYGRDRKESNVLTDEDIQVLKYLSENFSVTNNIPWTTPDTQKEVFIRFLTLWKTYFSKMPRIRQELGFEDISWNTPKWTIEVYKRLIAKQLEANEPNIETFIINLIWLKEKVKTQWLENVDDGIITNLEYFYSLLKIKATEVNSIEKKDSKIIFLFTDGTKKEFSEEEWNEWDDTSKLFKNYYLALVIFRLSRKEITLEMAKTFQKNIWKNPQTIQSIRNILGIPWKRIDQTFIYTLNKNKLLIALIWIENFKENSFQVIDKELATIILESSKWEKKVSEGDIFIEDPDSWVKLILTKDKNVYLLESKEDIDGLQKYLKLEKFANDYKALLVNRKNRILENLWLPAWELDIKKIFDTFNEIFWSNDIESVSLGVWLWDQNDIYAKLGQYGLKKELIDSLWLQKWDFIQFNIDTLTISISRKGSDSKELEMLPSISLTERIVEFWDLEWLNIILWLLQNKDALIQDLLAKLKAKPQKALMLFTIPEWGSFRVNFWGNPYLEKNIHPSVIFSLPEFDFIKIIKFWIFDVYKRSGSEKDFFLESLTIREFFSQQVIKLDEIREGTQVFPVSLQEREKYKASVTFERIVNSYLQKVKELNEANIKILALKWVKNSSWKKELQATLTLITKLKWDLAKIVVFLKEKVKDNPDISRQVRDFFEFKWWKWKYSDTNIEWLFKSLDLWVIFGDQPYIVDMKTWILYKNNWKWRFFSARMKEVKLQDIQGNISLDTQGRTFQDFRNILSEELDDNSELKKRAFITELQKLFDIPDGKERSEAIVSFKKLIVEENLQSRIFLLFTSKLPDWRFKIDFLWFSFFQKILTSKEFFDESTQFIEIESQESWEWEIDGNIWYFQNNWNGNFLNVIWISKYEVLQSWDIIQKKKLEDIDFEQIGYTPLARELWKLIMNPKWNRHYGRWLDGDCWGWVWDILVDFWFSSLSRDKVWESRKWRIWWQILDPLVASWHFIRVKIDNHTQAKPGGILWYGATEHWSPARRHAGHVEIVWGDGRYYYDGVATTAAGSALRNFSQRKQEELITNPKQYKTVTWFSGYVYYPVRSFRPPREARK